MRLLMGLCQSDLDSIAMADKQQYKTSKMIDREIEKQSKAMPPQKLLLLGPGESGKSTTLKQIKILHHDGFTDVEIEERKFVVYQNLMSGVAQILEYLDKNGYKLIETDALEARETYEKFAATKPNYAVEEIPPKVKWALQVLWKDKQIQYALEYRNEYHLSESILYFLENVERIAKPDYKPTIQDILHTRVPTTGVVKMRFVAKDIDFEVYDVGGQRSERRKWLYCFDNVNAIIFIVAVSEYDQVLKEDNATNRLYEAIELYRSIAASNYFTNTSIILFLNKKDLFEQKVTKIPIKNFFKDYKGEDTFEDGIQFIRKKFDRATNTQREKRPYFHVTQATDTRQIEVVISCVLDAIIQENLKDTGMV